LPRSTDPDTSRRTRSRAAVADSVSRSTTTTSAPEVRNAWAMPAPIRPPPSTPTMDGRLLSAMLLLKNVWFCLDAFDQHGGTLADTDTHGGQTARLLFSFQPRQQGDDNTRA